MKNFDGLILSGGESIIIGKFLIEIGLKDEILSLIYEGMLVWGICVGVILFFKNIKNQGSGVFFVFSIVIERNVYGS